MKYVRLKNLRPEVGFEVFPQVYCVAYNESYRTEFWKQGPGGQWNKLEANPIFHEKLGRDKTYYIRATGSCKGKEASIKRRIFSISCCQVTLVDHCLRRMVEEGL